MGTFKFIKGSIMLWSYFRANGMDPLVVVHEKIKLHTPIAKTDAILYREKPSKDRWNDEEATWSGNHNK